MLSFNDPFQFITLQSVIQLTSHVLKTNTSTTEQNLMGVENLGEMLLIIDEGEAFASIGTWLGCANLSLEFCNT